MLVTKGRLQVDSASGKSALTIRARHLIDSIRAEYAGTPIAEPATPATECGREVEAELRAGEREPLQSSPWFSAAITGRVPSEVTLDNWQSAAHLHWTFQHIADFLPTAAISRGTGPVAELPSAPGELTRHSDLAVDRTNGKRTTVGDVMAATSPTAGSSPSTARCSTSTTTAACTPTPRTC